MNFRALPAEERFWASIIMVENCWEWTGPVDKDGYARMRHGRGNARRAHRWAYERFVGPIPDGLTIDHLCNNKGCVNPAHLRPATNVANIMRGNGFGAKNARKELCPKGHPLDGRGIRPDGRKKRRCKTCARMRVRELRGITPDRWRIRDAVPAAAPSQEART